MNASWFRHVRLVWVFAITVCLLLSWQVHEVISGDPVQSDARQNLSMAYNLYASGNLSRAEDAPFVPTNYREPLPPTVTAAFLALSADIHLPLALQGLFEGEGARLVKRVNVVWIGLGLVGCWVLTYLMCRRHWVSLVAVLAAYLFFFSAKVTADTLYTELPAAVLLVWTAVVLVWLSYSNRLWPSALSGLLLGMLALTKAVFLYVFLALLPFLVLYYVLARRDLKISTRWIAMTLFSLCFLITVGSWMVRNKVVLDRFEISQRGGIVLLVRALKDGMSTDEVAGAYWLWGPALYKRLVRGSPWGFSDTDFALGGRFQRLNRDIGKGDGEAETTTDPQRVVSFYKQARAGRRQLQGEFIAARREHPDNAADDLLRARAVEMIVAAPGAHLAMTPLFLWRGIWCFPDVQLPFNAGGYQGYVINAVNAVAYLSLFGVFAFGLARRRYDLVAMTVVSLGMLACGALFSHNIPRYSAPAIPIMLISLLVAMCGVVVGSPKRGR